MPLLRASAARIALRSGILIAVLMAVLVGLQTPAGAHAVLIETDPGFDRVVDNAPQRVTLRFSEPVEIALGAIRVYRGDGERVDTGSVQQPEPSSITIELQPNLERGTYTTTWSAISADSHPIRGAFVWHVRAPGPQRAGIADDVLGSGAVEEALFGVARAATFGGLLLLAGASAFGALLWRRPGRSLEDRPPEIEGKFARRWRILVLASALTVGISTLAGLVLQTATAAGVSIAQALNPELLGEVLATRYGRAALLRLGILFAFAVGLFVSGRRGAARTSKVRSASVGAASTNDGPSPTILVAAGAALLVLMATPGLAGHAATVDPVIVSVAIDALHLTAAGVWIGGLTTLLLAAFPSTSDLGETERTRTLAPVVARFSDVAVIAVAVVVFSGVYRALDEVATLEGLTGTSYGLTLLAKIAIVLIVVALGAVNNRVFKPRISSAAASATGSGALWKLRRTVTVEVGLAVVVVAVTALLVNLPPARSEVESGRPLVTDVRIGDNNLNVLVDPARVGENIVHLTATRPSGAPMDVRGMTVRFELPARDIGPLVARGRKLAPGHYVVQGHQLSVAGEWRVGILVGIDKFTQQRAIVQFEVSP